MTFRNASALLGALVLAAAEAGAVDGELPPAVPRPEFIRNRPFIPDLLLRNKVEGRYWTGIPAVGFDAEEGINVGAFVELYDNGPEDDPFFRTAPYRQKLFFGGVVTSEEIVRLLARFDQPYIRDTPHRLRLDFLFETNDINNYHGVGGSSIDLVSPRTGNDYTSYEDYQDDLDTFIDPGVGACPAGPTACHFSRYNKYKARDVIGVVSLERDLLGGLVRPLLGFQVRWIDVDDYTGENTERLDSGGKGIQLPTRLFTDCAAGRITGCNGGWDNALRLGLAYDSRDFEPNPGRGILAETVLQVSSKAFGASHDYQRLTFSGNWFHDFFYEREGPQQLIFAGRAMYNMVFSDAPFYALARLGFTDHDRRGLGGFGTLRGYKIQRFFGKSAVLFNGELRWFFTEGTLFGQHLRPGWAVFGDTGRSWDDVALTFERWRGAGGVGFRLAWNLATLISVDVGVSPENAVFYLELGSTF